mmetsp:Transcript_116791/g.330426  ORF Transcript_116791/g.330426 Transcript_116791/m.330426 type:complete len:355 (-) Transcript_116791:1030-2094(-)
MGYFTPDTGTLRKPASGDSVHRKVVQACPLSLARRAGPLKEDRSMPRNASHYAVSTARHSPSQTRREGSVPMQNMGSSCPAISASLPAAGRPYYGEPEHRATLLFLPPSGTTGLVCGLAPILLPLPHEPVGKLAIIEDAVKSGLVAAVVQPREHVSFDAREALHAVAIKGITSVEGWWPSVRAVGFHAGGEPYFDGPVVAGAVGTTARASCAAEVPTTAVITASAATSTLVTLRVAGSCMSLSSSLRSRPGFGAELFHERDGHFEHGLSVEAAAQVDAPRFAPPYEVRRGPVGQRCTPPRDVLRRPCLVAPGGFAVRVPRRALLVVQHLDEHALCDKTARGWRPKAPRRGRRRL